MSDEEFYDSDNEFSGSENENMYSEGSESEDDLSQNGLDKEDEFPIEVLEYEKIKTQMAESVKEVKNVTMIPENKVKTLLNHSNCVKSFVTHIFQCNIEFKSGIIFFNFWI